MVAARFYSNIIILYVYHNMQTPKVIVQGDVPEPAWAVASDLSMAWPNLVRLQWRK